MYCESTKRQKLFSFLLFASSSLSCLLFSLFFLQIYVSLQMESFTNYYIFFIPMKMQLFSLFLFLVSSVLLVCSFIVRNGIISKKKERRRDLRSWITTKSTTRVSQYAAETKNVDDSEIKSVAFFNFIFFGGIKGWGVVRENLNEWCILFKHLRVACVTIYGCFFRINYLTLLMITLKF